MSIYATLWRLKFPSRGDEHNRVQVIAPGVRGQAQEYVDPLLGLSGREYSTMSFEDLHRRICDALRGDRPRLVAESWGPDGRCRLHFEDGSVWERRS
jgi:hypothetical protein